ncbi:MAG TPA: hypothetical protein VNV43_09680, partial [Candidatus Acidoferrales bacterium]|nr:hypothetical protein [Candidatus Acidoferrales bacterium]
MAVCQELRAHPKEGVHAFLLMGIFRRDAKKPQRRFPTLHHRFPNLLVAQRRTICRFGNRRYSHECPVITRTAATGYESVWFHFAKK